MQLCDICQQQVHHNSGVCITTVVVPVLTHATVVVPVLVDATVIVPVLTDAAVAVPVLGVSLPLEILCIGRFPGICDIVHTAHAFGI